MTPEGLRRGREFVLRAEQEGFRQVRPPRELLPLEAAFKDGHVAASRFTFILMGALALLGAALTFAMVRRSDRLAPAGVFSRRSRWTRALSGEGPGITRKPPGVTSGGAGNDAGDGRRDPS